MDAQERATNHSDSDSSSESQDPVRFRRYQLIRGELRLLHQALLETSIDEGTRDILVDYFGGRFRSIPVRPRTPREVVEAPENAFTHTSIAEPEMGPSPNQLPPSMRANAARDRARDRQQEFQTRMKAVRVQIAERNEQRRLARVADMRAITFRAHRDSPELQQLLRELERRAQEFATNDSEAHHQWHQHRESTLLATNSQARQYRMLFWYHLGPERSANDMSRRVPSRLLRQIVRVERWYTRLARLEWRWHRAETDEGSRSNMPDTDNSWAGSPSYEPVGFESGEDGLGFENYTPRYDPNAEPERLLDHVGANFSVPRIRLLHASSVEELAILLARMQSFIAQALETFEHLVLMGETDLQLPEDFSQRVSDEMSLLTTFQEEGMEHDDSSGDDGSSEEESNASTIEDGFPDGTPTVVENARRAEEDDGTGPQETEGGEQGADQNEDQNEGQEDNQDEQRGATLP